MNFPSAFSFLPSRVPAERWPTLIALAAPLAILAAIGDVSSWTTLTLAGLAMGMMIFLMASGLSLIFGLMDVLNFGHGAFVTFGAFTAASVLGWLSGWTGAESAGLNLAALLLACAAAMAGAAALGWLFERTVVAPVYGAHLRQILITMGALIVAEELVRVVWGARPVALLKPEALRGSFVVGDIAFEKFRLFAVTIGLLVYFLMRLALVRTRVGLLVRAGVENREMVEAFGHRADLLFIGVFVAGSALAALGGVLWGLHAEIITATVGAEAMILAFIVVIIGGLGSVRGSFVGALLVGLTANYAGFLAPKLSLGSALILMVAVLLWRPAGLFPAGKT